MNQRSAFGQWLDVFRWVAAFVVLYGHTVNLFMIPASQVQGKKSLVHLAAAFPTGFAQQAVMVFFVISGLLVGGELYRQWQETGQVDSIAYLIKRLSRLWTVLVPIFLITWLCNWIGLTFFPTSAYYRSDTWQTMSASSFICNTSFLHLVLCRPYGNNGPLWSLFNEFWYYSAWLGFVWALTRRTRIQRLCWSGLVLAGLVLLTAFQYAGAPLAPYMAIWLLGVVVVWSPRAVVRSITISATILLICLMAIRLGVRRDFWEANPTWTFVLDFVAAATFANLLLSMRKSPCLTAPPAGGLFVRLADFSFTLYCVHEPLLHLYGTAFGIERVLPNSWTSALIIFTPIPTIILIAWLVSFATEKQTPRVRHYLQRMVGIPPGLAKTSAQSP